jgi:hypothetical protein
MGQAGCKITTMTDNPNDSTPLWYRASATNVVIFSLLWLGEFFLILLFLKNWVFHTGAAIYLLMIPWALIGLIMVVRPNWIPRILRVVEEKVERDMNRLDKWTPPGFP